MEKKAKRIQPNTDYSEEIKCSICLDFLYKPVTTIPCLHNVNWNDKVVLWGVFQFMVKKIKSMSSLHDKSE